MRDSSKTKQTLTEELAFLRRRIGELEQSEVQRKQAEEELRASEERYRLLFDAVPVGIGISDLEGTVQDANRSMQEITGYTLEDFKTITIGDTYTDLDERRQMLQVLREFGQVRDYEVRLKRKDGTVYPALLNIDLIEMEGRRVFLAVTRDITERKRADEAIKTAEDTYRNIFLNSQIGLYRTDIRTGLMLDANDAVARFIGYQDRASLLAEPFNIAERYADPDDREKMFSILQADGEFQNYEARFRKNDGSIRWVRFSARIVKEKGWLEGVSEDITDRKQVEEDLRESELKYRSLVDQSLLGILIVQDGRVMYANDMITEKCGYSTDELMAFSPIQVMELIHPNDREVVWNRMLSRFSGKKEPERNECRFIAKDDSIYWADVHTNVIEYSGKTAIQMCIVDISERKRVEEDLQFRNILLSTQQEASIDGILVVDEKNSILSYNRRFVEMWGLPAKLVEDRLDEPVLQFVTAKMADPQSFVQRVQYLYKHRQETSQDEILLADGRVFDRYSAPMLGSDDRYYGRVWYFRDITERKRAEEALISSESKYRNIFENAFEGIYQSTPEGRFITVNAAFAWMAGYDSPEDLIESIEDMETQLYVHPEDRKKILEIMATRGIDEGFEVNFYKKNGSTFWVVIKSRAVKDDRGEISYYEGNVEDITLRKRAEEKLLQTLESLRKAFGATIQAMVSAVEARDPYTAGHQLRSADLASAIATEMGLSQDRIEGIRIACSIHDLGKISIPAEILSKPAKLSVTEFSLIKEHPWKGYEILKNVESSWPMAEIVYQHHERMDGSGYPRNLKGDEILIEARILAVSDVVESMASHRPYRAALGLDAAMKEIEDNREILYDADVVDACLKLFREKGYQLKGIIL